MTASIIRIVLLAGLAVGPLMVPCDASADVDFTQTQAKFFAGSYDEALADTAEGIEGRRLRESWWDLRLELLLTLGRYDEAASELATALERLPQSVRLRHRGLTVLRMAGQSDEVPALRKTAQLLLSSQGWRYRINGDDLIVLGKMALADGEDPKRVLTNEYALAERRQASRAAALIAKGELALEKDDFALAGDAFLAADQIGTTNPAIPYGLARAFFPSDPAAAQGYLDAALAINPKHVPSLLLQARRLLDQERYDEVDGVLDDVFAVNPHHPIGWAYKSIIASLQANDAAAKAAKEKALASWGNNAEVPHTIGRELSRKYRFAAGADEQREALAMQPSFLRAKLQLATDLLRLGDEAEGWRLAEEVAEADEYNILAYNLSTLHDALGRYTVLAEGRFRVRMEADEATLYGPRVLEVLRRAEQTLPAKYETTLPETVYVDIYAKQADFAIRTFGMPGGIGYLGVCFGPVVTMNSPAATIRTPVSWESVLYHEFTHVVTLTKTNNRMPRWLSEGISVHEERLADPRWGQQMTPAFAAQLAAGTYRKPSELSAAFLQAGSGGDLQLAYFVSSMVVDYLVTEFGQDALLAILDDLGRGLAINDALERHTVPLESLDAAFADYVRRQLDLYGPGTDFTDPQFGPVAALRDVEAFVRSHPGNPLALMRLAQLYEAAERYEDALDALDTLSTSFATDPPLDALKLRAEIERKVGRSEDRLNTLTAIAARDAGAIDVHRELMALAVESGSLREAGVYAADVLAINPMSEEPHRVSADAALARDDTSAAIGHLQSLAVLGPFDPAALHYEIATLANQIGRDSTARENVLLAIEEAPRYREAHRLLLKIINQRDTASPNRERLDDQPRPTTDKVAE